MEYFKINDIDFSQYVSSLKVNKTATYNAQVNAAGNTVVDYINTKRTIEVGIIPVDAQAMVRLQQAIDGFQVYISFQNPTTNTLEENVNCVIPSSGVEFYTIQVGKVMYKAFNLTFTEL